VTANQARRQVTQRAGAEPQAHHLAAHSLRRQQSHGRQTNRTQAQLTERQHQDAAHQPQRRHTGPAVAQDVLRRQHHQAKARRCAQDANHEFGHTARTHVFTRQRRPRPAEYRREQNDKQGVNRLEPDRGDLKVADHPVGVVVSKQVKGGRFLFKRGPEKGRRDQQNKAHQQARPLFTVQPSEDEQPDEIERHGGGNHIDQHAGHRHRVNHDRAQANQRDQHCHPQGQGQQPRSDAILFRHRAVPGGIEADLRVIALHRRHGKDAENDQRYQHPDPPDAEAPVPAMGFNQPAGDQGRDKRADVDPHVEQRKTAVAARVAFFIQGADHH